MNVLVLGAYGLIGQAVVRELLARGHDVTGLARAPTRGEKLLPEVRWIAGDLNHLLFPEDWDGHLAGINAVVNASGALQSGLKDDLGRVQRDAIVALIGACAQAGVSRFVQISAPGARRHAATEFMATKGEADAALRKSRLDWVILKPGLVISETAYGGTSLIRMLAAFPLVQPIALAEARLQSIDVRDVARAVARALSEPGLAEGDFDLVAPQSVSLEEIVLTFRNWLGFSPPVAVWRLPHWLAMAMGRLADGAGYLGWRAPLRTTALKVLDNDVIGDPEPWRRATGEEFSSLAETLKRMPSTRQERVFARVQLVFPVLVVLFALFWIASGVIGLWQLTGAASLVAGQLGETAALLSVGGGAAVDISVGAAMLARRTFVPACIAAILVSAAYLILGSLLTPELWADPLGPLLKIFPVIGVALSLIAMAEER
ncbi:MAG: SDR family oxidoreductase [Alphaproteobacteria bacterium]|nr:SDR family oxidoreductase [Alphaproteobacteria bacterium]